MLLLPSQDIRLVVEIKNQQPLELLDLTKSFISIANQFQSYVSEFGESQEDRQAKLYVREIKTGSVILDLVEYASIGVLPFIENVNTITGFAEFIKKAFNFILGRSKEKPKEFSQSDLRDLSQIINPIANENGSQINISSVINGGVHTTFVLNNEESNAAQNMLGKMLKEMRSPEGTNDIKTKVLLTLYQIRADVKAKTGNMGIIEDVSTKPLKLIFDDEEINNQMLHGDFNPNETVYVVDAQPQHAGGRIAAYKILKVHETFQKPESDREG